MGGARNLKLKATGGKGQGTWSNNFCCVHRRDVAGSGGSGERNFPEVEILLAFGHAMEAANLPAF